MAPEENTNVPTRGGMGGRGTTLGKTVTNSSKPKSQLKPIQEGMRKSSRVKGDAGAPHVPPGGDKPKINESIKT